MADHTALPWQLRISTRSLHIGGRNTKNFLIRSDSLDPMMLGQGERDVALVAGEANARFIVQACNAHEELLEAAMACFATVSYPAPEGGAWWRLTTKEVDILQAAIVKAKGGDERAV